MYKINGINYVIYKTGSHKPFIIMVHGFTQNHKVFIEQIKYFKKDYNLLLVDLRGHGESLDGIGPYGITEYAEDIASIILNCNIQEFYYWGTHTGTAIGLLLALKYRKKIKGLIFEGTVLPGFDMPRVNELIVRAKQLSTEQSVERAKQDWFDNADWFEYIRSNPIKCRAELHKELILEFRGEPWINKDYPKETINVNERLGELVQPILIYNGEFDMEDFIRVADRMELEVKQLYRGKIKDAGGFPCWENAQEVNMLVSEFLESFKWSV